MEQPHELRYRCPENGCPWSVTAPALDPIADEVIAGHVASHDAVLTAKWAHSHVAQPSVWDPAREPVGGIVGSGVVGLAALALLVVAVGIVAGWF